MLINISLFLLSIALSKPIAFGFLYLDILTNLTINELEESSKDQKSNVHSNNSWAVPKYFDIHYLSHPFNDPVS